MKFLRRIFGAKTGEQSASKLPRSHESIIRDYGKFIIPNPPLPTRIEDVSVLPHPKEVILESLLLEIAREQSTKQNEMLQQAAFWLAQYQPDVGRTPLEKLGMDISKLPRTDDLNALREQARRIVEAESSTRDRYNEFNKLVEADLERIASKISTALGTKPE